jgi:hypothetical protein|tara:strand:- start:119 stop:985 length:867 start_codon:yes stop_codon:yes gene_type:complete
MPNGLLQRWLQRQLDEAATGWLSETLQKLADGVSDRDLFLAFSLVPRKIGKDDLRLQSADVAAAETARTGWKPVSWSTDQAARVLILLSSGDEGLGFSGRLEQLCQTADVRELIALYQGLPLYPGQELFVDRAREGLRTNMKAVFEAVAHDNPYPFEQFSTAVWNQMVLKAIFVESPLHPIHGLDRRRNEDLARTLVDYAHERWAAGRTITPELWRPVAPFMEDAIVTELQEPFSTAEGAERQAMALALHEAGGAHAHALLESVPDLVRDIEADRISWETVSQDMKKP